VRGFQYPNPTPTPPTCPTSILTPVSTLVPTSNFKTCLWDLQHITLLEVAIIFDSYVGISNYIGSRVTKDVKVQLFDFNGVNKKGDLITSKLVTIFATNPNPKNSEYSLNISQSNIGEDTDEFVFSTGPSKFLQSCVHLGGITS